MRSLAAADLPEIVRKIRARTPARLLVGRAGAAYRTDTQLDLREAHAAARDAVRAELDLQSAFRRSVRANAGSSSKFARRRAGKMNICCGPISAGISMTHRAPKYESAARRETIFRSRSATACRFRRWRRRSPRYCSRCSTQAPTRAAGRSVSTFVIRHCRVGILNEIGELLNPRVAVLLIGERPGFATAESLSAYMAYRPRATHTDADRNLISNIHARGLSA